MKKEIIIVIVAAMLAGCSSRENHPQPLSEGLGADSPATDTLCVPSNYYSPLQGESGASMIGKVVATRFADLSFEAALPIERVMIRNGQQVRRGQILAQLDQYKLRNAIEQQQRTIEQAELQIEQAHLQMQDVIISQGYDPDKHSSIPSEVKHNADVKSGYALSKSQLATAKTQLAAAQHELRSGVLTAPFDGIVANLSIQAHQLAQPGQTVCRVIATGDMAVEFRVMEADLCKYKIGTGVTVVPVADKSTHYSATVSEINPIVDEQGAITLRARIGEALNLFDGMNVEVILE